MATERVYVDHGLTGTNRGDRPGLREALAACSAGDTLVVTKLDRLARSVHDARQIADELAARHVNPPPPLPRRRPRGASGHPPPNSPEPQVGAQSSGRMA